MGDGLPHRAGEDEAQFCAVSAFVIVGIAIFFIIIIVAVIAVVFPTSTAAASTAASTPGIPVPPLIAGKGLAEVYAEQEQQFSLWQWLWYRPQQPWKQPPFLQ